MPHLALQHEVWFVSDAALNHQLLELCDRLGRIQTLGARFGAIQNGLAPIKSEPILEVIEPIAGRLVARIVHPAIGL